MRSTTAKACFNLLLFVVSLCSMTTHAAEVRTIDSAAILKDTELLEAMEIFVGMSAAEREEAITGLMAKVGDDPKKQAEMDFLLKKVSEMEDSGSLKQMVQDDEIAKAKREAARQLDGSNWESFWEMQAQILEATLESGQLSPEDAARFKTDEDAWKKQLRTIWDDLQKQKGGQEL